MTIDFILNGKNVSYELESDKRLLDFIRDDLKLTGTKEGCGEGECGACTIIVNNKAVNSCLMFTSEINGTNVLTIEGLEKNGEIDLIQQAFIDKGAVQCGFCTPGFIMSIKALLIINPNPSEEEIIESIEGNLCRCTGYYKILDAVKEVINKINE